MNAALSLGRLLEDGVKDIPADPSRAMELYTRAMNAGIDSALNEVARLHNIGKGVERNLSYAAKIYNRAIEEAGSVEAMRNLALLLEDGAEGVPKDPKRAVQRFYVLLKNGGC